MSGCPCEPNGTDGLTCPDKDGRLLCQTSPSRARPSDRAIAQAFWDMANQANRHVRADELASSIITQARELDASPEARAGDCLTGPLDPEGLIRQFQGDARLMPQTIVALARELLTTKATP